MISKSRLMAIKDLQLSGVIEEMNGEQLDKYCKDLDAFVEGYPARESELKKSFEAGDFDSLSETLLNLWYELLKIHANGLGKSCRKLISEIGIAEREIVESKLTHLLTAISAFSIDIQMAQYKEWSQIMAGASNPAPATKTGQKVILAVDDVKLFLNSLRLVLQSASYKIVGVKSGADALLFIKNHNPDLFILDIEMPEMNGYELAQKIREDGQTAPIIFLTGNSSKEDVVKAIQAGAADFIVKPIDKEQVLDKVKKHIS